MFVLIWQTQSEQEQRRAAQGGKKGRTESLRRREEINSRPIKMRASVSLEKRNGVMIGREREERTTERQIKHSPTLHLDFGASVPTEKGDLPFPVIALCQANLNSAFYTSAHTQGRLALQRGFLPRLESSFWL